MVDDCISSVGKDMSGSNSDSDDSLVFTMQVPSFSSIFFALEIYFVRTGATCFITVAFFHNFSLSVGKGLM